MNSRFDKKTDDTYYGFCSLSEYYQKKGPEKRKRLNFKCDGKLNIHYNEDYISLMVMHHNDHVKVKKEINQTLLLRIKEMSLTYTPGQIFKELKSEGNLEEIINLTRNQVDLLTEI